MSSSYDAHFAIETGATGAGAVSAFNNGVAAMSASNSRRVMGLLLLL
jgi:hypothetical protein